MNVTTTRRSRFKPTQKLTPTGRQERLVISGRDVEIFEVLQRYRYLNKYYLYALVHNRGNFESFSNRLTKLFHSGVLARPPAQYSPQKLRALFQESIYELAPSGHSYMAENDLDIGVNIGTGASFPHEVLTCFAIASLELSSTDIRFVHWPELLKFNKLPESTKVSATPFHIPLVGLEQKSLIADGAPIVWIGKRAICMAGIETDLSNETQKGKGKATLRKKFVGYRNIARHRTYKKHFGFPNMISLFLFTSEKRMRKAMTNLQELIKNELSAVKQIPVSHIDDKDVKCSYILFTYVDQFSNIDENKHPVNLISPSWERVGHPPFNLESEVNRK